MFKRPVFWLSGIVMTVCTFLVHTRLSMLIISLLVFPFILMVKDFLGKGLRILTFIVVLVIFVRYAMVCGQYDEVRQAVNDMQGITFVATGEIRRHNPFEERKVDLRLSEVNYTSDMMQLDCLVGKTVLLDVEGEVDALPYGKYVSVPISLKSIEGAGNPGEFDYLLYAYNGGLVARATIAAESIRLSREVRSDVWSSLRYKLDCLRDETIIWISKRLEATNGVKSHGLAVAMLLGFDTLIDEEELGDYYISGTVHILTVSGFHFAFVHALLSNGLKMLPLGYRGKFGLSMAFVLFFVWLTGVKFAPVRAAVSMEIYLLAPWFKRRFDFLTAVSMLVLFELLLNPLKAADMSLVLTFMACIGIGCIHPALSGIELIRSLRTRLPLKMEAMLNVLLISFCCSVTTGLVIFQGNNRINGVAWLSNLMMAGVSGLFMTYEIMLAILGLQSDTWSSRFQVLSEMFAWIMREVNGLYARMPWNTVHYRPDLDLYGSILWYGFLAMFIFSVHIGSSFRKRIFKISMLVMVGVVIVEMGQGMVGHMVELVVFDVGQGDSTMVKAGKDALVFDAGPTSFDLQNQLFEHGIKNIGAIFLTHEHADHTGGLVSLVQGVSQCGNRQSVEKVHMPKYFVTGADGRLSAIEMEQITPTGLSEMKGIAVIALRRVDLVDADGTTIDGSIDPEDENVDMTVYWISKEGFDTLIMGDATEEFEELLSVYFLANPVTFEVLRVGHHGSSSSTTESFIDAIAPRIAIVSVGKNHYGHPAESVLERLTSRGVEVFDTKSYGQMTIRIGKDVFLITNWGKNPFNWKRRVL